MVGAGNLNIMLYVPVHTNELIDLSINNNIFYHSCGVLISTVSKSTDALPLVFFNNSFANEDFKNGSYADRGSILWK